MRIGRELVVSLSILLAPAFSYADERFFTYSYQADVLKEGATEFEQQVTNQSGRKEGEYSEWDFRSEIEHGVTSNLMTALYLNLQSVRQENFHGEDSEHDFNFKGISSEWVYQLLNPTLDPVGLAIYGEYTTDGIDHELEGKILLSKHLDDIELALNAVYEGESESKDGVREREGTAQFTAGAAFHLNNKWSAGLELRNKSAYPGGFNLSGQEYQTMSVGPNVHYGSSNWWGTLTVLPQVWGNGEESSGSRQLVHEESLEVRLIVGIEIG